MRGYRTAVHLLPLELRHPLQMLDAAAMRSVQEIRLRKGQAVSLGVGGEEWFVTERGDVIKEHVGGIVCTEQMLQRTVDRMLQYSVYAHQEELSRGFVTVDGCRVGIAGTAVTECGRVLGYRSLSALCIRVARSHDGCAEVLMPFLFDGNVHSALICSEPGGGKTSILRDIATQFSRRRISVTVIDERGELDGGGLLMGCDVLRYVPKAVGIEQAVRCLAPRLVLLDELGDADELLAVCDGFLRGVPTVATVHACTAGELRKRKGLRDMLERGIFDYVVWLSGREAPGCIAQVLRTEDLLHERNRCADPFVDGAGTGDDGSAYIGETNTPSLVI